MTSWVGVTSKDHVLRAIEGGFCQVHHGKEAPLRRIARDDHILYYSPREGRRAGATVRAFTAIGRIEDDEPHQVTAEGAFKPFRRRVHYLAAHDAPIAPLLDRLAFTRGRASWGQAFRRGLFKIEDDDYVTIARAMGVGA